MFVCLDDFIADQLSCSLPWTSRQVSGSSRQCQTEVDLQAFKNSVPAKYSLCYYGRKRDWILIGA